MPTANCPELRILSGVRTIYRYDQDVEPGNIHFHSNQTWFELATRCPNLEGFGLERCEEEELWDIEVPSHHPVSNLKDLVLTLGGGEKARVAFDENFGRWIGGQVESIQIHWIAMTGNEPPVKAISMTSFLTPSSSSIQDLRLSGVNLVPFVESEFQAGSLSFPHLKSLVLNSSVELINLFALALSFPALERAELEALDWERENQLNHRDIIQMIKGSRESQSYLKLSHEALDSDSEGEDGRSRRDKPEDFETIQDLEVFSLPLLSHFI